MKFSIATAEIFSISAGAIRSFGQSTHFWGRPVKRLLVSRQRMKLSSFVPFSRSRKTNAFHWEKTRKKRIERSTAGISKLIGSASANSWNATLATFKMGRRREGRKEKKMNHEKFEPSSGAGNDGARPEIIDESTIYRRNLFSSLSDRSIICELCRRHHYQFVRASAASLILFSRLNPRDT